jgi:DNA-binding CsgD family transcriptional regulator
VVDIDIAQASAQPQRVSRQLTPRELEVLEQLAQHLPPKLIAERLNVAPHTVYHRIDTAKAKLGVSTINDAVRTYKKVRGGCETLGSEIFTVDAHPENIVSINAIHTSDGITHPQHRPSVRSMIFNVFQTLDFRGREVSRRLNCIEKIFVILCISFVTVLLFSMTAHALVDLSRMLRVLNI